MLESSTKITLNQIKSNQIKVKFSQINFEGYFLPIKKDKTADSRQKHQITHSRQQTADSKKQKAKSIQ